MPIETANRDTVMLQKPELEYAAARKRTYGKSKKNAAASPTTPNYIFPIQSPTSTIEETSDLHDNAPLHACVELTRRVPTPIFCCPGWHLSRCPVV